MSCILVRSRWSIAAARGHGSRHCCTASLSMFEKVMAFRPLSSSSSSPLLSDGSGNRSGHDLSCPSYRDMYCPRVKVNVGGVRSGGYNAPSNILQSQSRTCRPGMALFDNSRCCFSTNGPTAAALHHSNDDDDDDDQDVKKGPTGDLFHAPVDPSLAGKTASVRRVFGPRSNAQAMLTCGGPALAKHASFDPQWKRARDWIRNHSVGPAVLSPVLIHGLVGALVEAAVPHSIPIRSAMRQIRPLIVGVEVEATITVIDVHDPSSAKEQPAVSSTSSSSQNPSSSSSGDDDYRKEGDGNFDGGIMDDKFQKKNGYEVTLKTSVTRVRDGAVIAEGSHSIWIPDYLHM